MPRTVDFKRTLNTFASRGASLASLYPSLAQLRSSFRLRLTQHCDSGGETDADELVDGADHQTDAEYPASSTAAPTEDDFAVDTACIFQLQELLYSDSAESNTGSIGVCLIGKLHLLLLLQENADALVRTRKGLVQLLTFLLDLSKMQQQPVQLTAQAMVCCCSLMIARDLLRDEHQLCSKFISYLLDLAGSVNSIHGVLLRFRSLQCLIALEDAYPCLLAKKLDYFYEFCAIEKSYLSEYYYSLFSLLLVHVFDACVKDSGGWSDERLSSRIESLPAMSLSSIQPLRGRQSLAPTAQSPTPSSPTASSSSPELSRAVGLLIGALDAGRLSPRAFFAVCRSVGRLLDSLGLGGQALRTAFYKRLPVWDVAVLWALAGLRHRFGLAALGCSDDSGCDKLAMSMQRVVSSPLFPAPLRLLMGHCLAAYPHLRVCQGSDTFPEPASRQLVGALFPGLFDPIDLRVLKVRLLSLRFSPRDSSDEASACLMGTLVSLSRPAQKSGGRGRHAVAFFASLYAVFARHHASVLGDDIRQMLISMINANLAFAEHLLDFLDCVTQDFPDSELPYQAYSELCDWVSINSVENASDRQSLARYMTILNRAAMYSRIPPQPIVDCLAQLADADPDNRGHFDNVDADKINWLCGHLLLDVCRSIFRTHWRRLETNAALLSTLCAVLARWAGDNLDIDRDVVSDVDVDVRSRAQLYYSLACHLSARRLASVVFEASTTDSAAAVSKEPPLQQPAVQLQSARTRTSLAVGVPAASQSGVPELRLLAESPVELTLMSPGMLDADGLEAGRDSDGALILPARLTCRRTSELTAETDLLAVDLTFATCPDPADSASSATGDHDHPVATVDPIHLARLQLPAAPSYSSPTTTMDLRLRVVCHRPLPCRLLVRLDCTSATDCRPLTAQLAPVSLGLADLLQPVELIHRVNDEHWCRLDQPGASFIRCPSGASAAAVKLARFRLVTAGEELLDAASAEASAEANAEASAEANAEANAEASAEANAEASAEANAEASAEANTEASAEANAEANSTSARLQVGHSWHFGFRVAPSCQLRLTLRALPAADLLEFQVTENQSDSSMKISRDAWQLLLHFDRYLKSLFGATEEVAVKL